MKYKDINKNLIIFLIIIAGLFLSFYFFHESTSRLDFPVCKNGFIDLSNWDFAENGNIQLNGYWEFYPNTLLNPEDFHNKALPQSLYIKVPNRWATKETHNKILDKGVGTYRLKVKVHNDVYMYGLKTTNIRSSCKIFVNGKEVGKSGNPAKNIEDGYISNIIPIVSFFTPEKGLLDIVIQVSNLDYYNGGIIQSIYFGSKEKIMEYYFKVNVLETIAVSFLLLTSIYYFVIYLRRKSDRRFLYFGFFCIAYAYVTSTGNEKLFNVLFESLPFLWILRVKIAMVCFGIIFVCLFIREMSTDLIPNNFKNIIIVFMCSNILLILFVPTKYISILEKLVSSLNILTYFVIGLLIFKAIINKKHKNLNKKIGLIILIEIILMEISYIAAILYFYSLINSYAAILAVLIFILIGAAAMLADHYTKAYDELEAISVRLIQADKIKDEFLINTSHEFKTPLNGIINIAKSTLDTNIKDSTIKQRENITYIIAIASRLSSLVNDMIDFENLKNKSIKLNKSIFDINSTIHSVVYVLSHMIKGDNIKITNNIPVGKYYAYTDENRLKQIMVNLVSNSLKYTEQGYVEITANISNDYIYISVTDTGLGIDPTVQKGLFGQNAPIGDKNFSYYSSSGLGLSISKLLASNMDGDVYLEYSELGKGSTFVVKIPKANKIFMKENKYKVKLHKENHHIPYYNSIDSESPNKKNNISAKKLLIVDDEASNIKVLKEIFKEEDYQILTAYSGYQALDMIKNNKDISIVLLDVMMPGLSGYEVCKNIRQEYKLFELPILLLTVRNTPEDISIGLDAGANDFLEKPFDLKELKARVMTLQKMKESVENAIKVETIFLQSQIKPHFLYNALNAIIYLCYTDGERAGDLLAELSNYMRCSFNVDPHNSFVSLKKEISLIESYIKLEKVRFLDKLKVEWSIDPNALNHQIPALIIQPLVENAIQHGIMKQSSGGIVQIFIDITDDNIMNIVIKDNGIGIASEKLKALLDNTILTNSIGLKNVNKRLINEYGKGLTIQSIEKKGTTVSINIPI